MKRFGILILSISLLIFSVSPVFADDLNSTNYKIIDAQIGSGTGQSSSANYSILTQLNNGVQGAQLNSSLYSLGSGHAYTFMANVPKVQCFETTTSGTSSCTGLPHAQGMVQECGQGGCYDRAKVMIDAQNNPTDTVYLIEISSDNWATVMDVDGATHFIETAATRTLADYQTKTAWEGGSFTAYNVFGLTPGVAYKVRIRALHGNFTESNPGPEATATTALPTITFDLDTGTTSGSSNNPPYSIAIGNLNPQSPVVATNRIWVSLATNSLSGAGVSVQDNNSGLRSAFRSYTIASANEDLNISSNGDGFGLKSGSVTNDTTAVGFFKADAQYITGNSTTVGSVISGTPKQIFCTRQLVTDTCSTGSGSPVLLGRGEVQVIAVSSLATKPATDYQTLLTFTASANW